MCSLTLKEQEQRRVNKCEHIQTNLSPEQSAAFRCSSFREVTFRLCHPAQTYTQSLSQWFPKDMKEKIPLRPDSIVLAKMARLKLFDK